MDESIKIQLSEANSKLESYKTELISLRRSL